MKTMLKAMRSLATILNGKSITREHRFRLYSYQKALGIKLKIKSVDVSPLSENIINPVLFTFEIVG